VNGRRNIILGNTFGLLLAMGINIGIEKDKHKLMKGGFGVYQFPLSL